MRSENKIFKSGKKWPFCERVNIKGKMETERRSGIKCLAKPAFFFVCTVEKASLATRKNGGKFILTPRCMGPCLKFHLEQTD